MGYALYDVSMDSPSAHSGLIQRAQLDFGVYSDPERELFIAAGILEPDAETINRGLLILDPAGNVAYREVTRDPATALFRHLSMNE